MSKTAFDLRQIKAVVFDIDGVLSPSTVPMSPEGVPMRMANIKDGFALQLAVKRGLKMAIISGASTEAVDRRYHNLGFTDVYLGIPDKDKCLRRWMADNGLSRDQVAYVGDDLPDLPAMALVGLPVAPADAVAEVKAKARYVTQAAGGYGVARELLEQILRARDLWYNDGLYSW